MTPFLLGIGGFAFNTTITTVQIICADIQIVPKGIKDYKIVILGIDATRIDGEEPLQPPVSCHFHPDAVLGDLQIHSNKDRIIGFKAECGYPKF